MTGHAHFNWNELATRDVEKAKAIYADVAGWTYDQMTMFDGSTYWVAMVGGNPVAGLFQMDNPIFDEASEHWLSYIAFDDVDEAIAKAAKHGMTPAREPFDVPGVGRIAVMQQPGGAMIGWMTPSEN